MANDSPANVDRRFCTRGEVGTSGNIIACSIASIYAFVWRTSKRPLHDAQLRTIEARLQCEEEVVRGHGRKRKRVQMIVHDERLTPSVIPAMERLEIHLPIRIPAQGPPSMWYEAASITWHVKLRMKMTGCPNTASSFEIFVLPAVLE